MTERTDANAPTTRGSWRDTHRLRGFLHDLEQGKGTVNEAEIVGMWWYILATAYPDNYGARLEVFTHPDSQDRVRLLLLERRGDDLGRVPVLAVKAQGTTPTSDALFDGHVRQLGRDLAGLQAKYNVTELYGIIAAGRACKFYYKDGTQDIKQVRSTSMSVNRALDLAEDESWVLEHLNKARELSLTVQ